MVGEARRDGDVEVGDYDLHAVFVGVVEIFVDVLLADEIAVLA